MHNTTMSQEEIIKLIGSLLEDDQLTFNNIDNIIAISDKIIGIDVLQRINSIIGK
jgi:hypothetical protein